MDFLKIKNVAVKPAFSAVKPSMKFMIFNLSGTKLNNPLIFNTILNMS